MQEICQKNAKKVFTRSAFASGGCTFGAIPAVRMCMRQPSPHMLMPTSLPTRGTICFAVLHPLPESEGR